MKRDSKAYWLCLPLTTCLLILGFDVKVVAEGTLLRDPAELFGVMQYQIPGLHDNREVVCHLFLRCMEREGLIDVQGFAVIEGVKEVHLQGGPQMAEPWGASLQNLTVSFHKATRSIIATFNVIEADLFPSVRPRVLALTLERDKFEEAYWLSFNEATRLIAIGDGLGRRCTPPNKGKNIKGAISLPPPFGIPSIVVAKLIRFHLNYHLRMGFDHQVMYSRSSKSVRATTFIINAVANKRFFFVGWTGAESGISLPNAESHKGYPLAYYDQSIILNHALLSYWGRKIYLMFLDLDEYFYSPGDLKVTELYQSHGCLNKIRNQAKIKRFLTVCNHCHGKSDWRSWVEIGDLSVLSRYEFVWRSNSSEFSDEWDLKTIADPDVTRHYHVHWGSTVGEFLKDGTALEGLADSSCAIVVHFMNLFVNRQKVKSRDRKDVEALRAILADEKAPGFVKLEFNISKSVLDRQPSHLNRFKFPSYVLNYTIKVSRNGSIIENVIE